MKQLFLDEAAHGTATLVTIEAKIRDGLPMAKDGVPQWVATVLMVPTDGQPELERVTITAPERPNVAPMTTIRLKKLVGRPWVMDGRAGVALSAAAIEPVQTARSANAA